MEEIGAERPCAGWKGACAMVENPIIVELTDDPAFVYTPNMLFRVPPSVTISSFEKLVGIAYRANVSDIHLASGEHVWFDLYGRMIQASNRPLLNDELKNLLVGMTSQSVLATLSSANPINRAASISPANLRNTSYRFRLNAVQCRVGKFIGGIQVTMRSIPDTPAKISTLGMPDEIMENLFPENGLCLFVGVTGSGKTTSLFAGLRHIAETMPDKKIITAEDPVEFTFEKVKCAGMMPSQIEIGSDLQSFEQCIQEAMRRAAEVLLIGECRKPKEFGSLIDAALSGHATYSTLHAESVDQTINRILNLFPSDEQPSIASKLMGSMKIIVAQKLVKSKDGKRCVAREWLVFDRETREYLSDIDFTLWTREIRRVVYKRGSSMLHDLVRLLTMGVISEETFFDSTGMKPSNAVDFLARVSSGQPIGIAA